MRYLSEGEKRIHFGKNWISGTRKQDVTEVLMKSGALRNPLGEGFTIKTFKIFSALRYLDAGADQRPAEEGAIKRADVRRWSLIARL